MDEITFLTLDDVLEIHRDQLARYGGLEGFIDRNVVESAVAQPQVSVFRNYLHEDIGEMAAAYLFHFAAAQGFSDGNKRTAAACTVIFLSRNGFDLKCTEEELYDLTMSVSTAQFSKEEAAIWIREHLSPIP